MKRNCYISTGGVNGYSLRRAVEELGCAAYLFEGVDSAYPFARGEPGPGDWVFFTEEASLVEHAGRSDLQMWPRSWPHDWSDKLEIARLIEATGEPVVETFALGGGRPPAYPFILKGRRSWIDGRRAPRGFLIGSGGELETRLAELRGLGWQTDDLIGQRYLPDGVTNCFSTAGFFDPGEPAGSPIIATRKLLAPSGGLGGSAAAVRTLRDDLGLIDRTRRILAALEYGGPFELELLRDEATGELCVLELNPRFWMQHGLFIDVHDNAVVRRYLGDPTAPIDPGRDAAWFAGPAVAAALSRPWSRYSRELLALLGRLALSETRVLIDPPLPTSLLTLIRSVVRRYTRS